MLKVAMAAFLARHKENRNPMQSDREGCKKFKIYPANEINMAARLSCNKI